MQQDHLALGLGKPGEGATLALEETPDAIPAIEKSFGQILIDIIPENPFASLAEGNVLPVIFFSILLGYFITRIREPQRTQIGDLFAGLRPRGVIVATYPSAAVALRYGSAQVEPVERDSGQTAMRAWGVITRLAGEARG